MPLDKISSATDCEQTNGNNRHTIRPFQCDAQFLSPIDKRGYRNSSSYDLRALLIWRVVSLNGAYSMKSDPTKRCPVGLHFAAMTAPRTQEVEADGGGCRQRNAVVASRAALSCVLAPKLLSTAAHLTRYCCS